MKINLTRNQVFRLCRWWDEWNDERRTLEHHIPMHSLNRARS